MGEISVLNQNRDFRRIYAKGRAFVDSAMVTYVLKNKKGCVRCGITASKKIGCAVERNRARRVIREAAGRFCGGFRRCGSCFCCTLQNGAVKKHRYQPGSAASAEGSRTFAKVTRTSRLQCAGEKAWGLIMKRILLGIIRFYQKHISAHTKACCGFTPPVRNMPLWQSTGLVQSGEVGSQFAGC